MRLCLFATLSLLYSHGHRATLAIVVERAATTKKGNFYAENLALKLGLAAVVRNYVWGWAIAETSFGGLSDGDYSSQFLSETALVQINWGYWDPNANDDYLTDELTFSSS